MEIKIRRYIEFDHDRVYELHKKALETINAYIGSGKWENDMGKLKEFYLDVGGEFLVGTINDQIVAMGALRKISDKRAEIKRMRVDPELQGRGYGQAILTALEKRARDLGFYELQLDTMVIQVAARHLYEKNGFRLYHKEMLGGHDCLFYEKKLDGAVVIL